MKALSASNRGVKNLCDSCWNAQRIVAHEVGVVHQGCSAFRTFPFHDLRSVVTDCSSYDKKAYEPPVFANEAWIFNVDEGKLTVTPPINRRMPAGFRHLAEVAADDE